MIMVIITNYGKIITDKEFKESKLALVKKSEENLVKN